MYGYGVEEDARVWASQISDEIWQKKLDLDGGDGGRVDDECSIGGTAASAIKAWWGMVEAASVYMSVGWKERLD